MTRVKNGNRELEFDGELLATSTSDDGHAQRWTDLALYRVADGRYVLQRTGKSAVYHTTNPNAPGKCAQAGEVMTPADAAAMHPDDELLDCLACHPGPLYENSAVRMEVDRCEAQVITTAKDVVAALHATDAKGVRYIARVSRRLLDAAARQDPGLHEEWTVERI